jgi:phosphatidylinositol alpha-1,6-mannosyltransferase
MRKDGARSVLLALTGLQIDGGIAGVSRCIAHALEQETGEGRLERVDRVLLLERPQDAAPAPLCGEQHLARGSQARFVWQTWRSHRRQHHDLVFFDLVGLARSVLLPFPGFPPRRFAIFVHGIELDTARRGSRARALREADRLLVNSEFTAAALRAALPGRADRVRVVPLCVDPERIHLWQTEDKGAPREREPAALLVGRISSEERGKGHDTLIEGWSEVRRRVPSAELWIAGQGDDGERLRGLARERGVEDAVRFLGRVSDAELGALYRRASVFAMPSRQEGFGLVYAEAMWHGLPCIGSTADAAGQVIVDGETGRLVPYGDVPATADAVAALLADPSRARAMGEAGQKRARARFGYERFRADLLAALDLADPAARREPRQTRTEAG